ncbi:MAG: TonB family protein [Pseudomonadota bacterium]
MSVASGGVTQGKPFEPGQDRARGRRIGPGGRNALGRLGVVVPAAGVTFALCLFMGRLIQTEFVEPPTSEVRDLPIITPTESEPDIQRTRRTKPTRMEDAQTPPPPPEISTTKSDIDLPTPVIQGEAPRELDYGRIDEFVVPPIVIDERDAKPINPPVPQYPRRMAERNIEGSCEVKFNVNARGEPIDIEAACSDHGFARAAEQAVGKVRFAPKIVRGQAVERRNVIYPLNFNLKG